MIYLYLILMVFLMMMLNFFHLLIFMLLMEFIVLFMSVVIFKIYQLNFTNWMMLYFIILSVCESVFGLSLIVLMTRYSGNDLLNINNLMLMN